MKTIGLLGGMSWESTRSYYEAINRGIQAQLGGLHSAKILLNSVDFSEIEVLQAAGRWQEAGELLAAAAKSVEAGGADCLLICTNTMHKVADTVEAAINIPLLHIADATGGRLKNAGITKIGLLGTRFTMEQEFYKNRLVEKFGIEVFIPQQQEREYIHKVIYEELCLGQITNSARERFVEIIDGLSRSGAEGIILGCTEIALLVQQSHCGIPLFDTTQIHADQAVNFSLD